MKRIFIEVVLCTVISSQKQNFNSGSNSGYWEIVKMNLLELMSNDVFSRLDISLALFSKGGHSGKLFYLQIPFKKNYDHVNQFVVLMICRIRD